MSLLNARSKSRPLGDEALPYVVEGNRVVARMRVLSGCQKTHYVERARWKAQRRWQTCARADTHKRRA
eukprot:3207292-Alexandrium_andersonii.AAC.1